MDRFGSRRVWENSQRGCLILRHPKSYLPTHSVIHKSAIRVLAIFADASRTGYAEAKFFVGLYTRRDEKMQAAQATLRQSPASRRNLRPCWDASRTGYAEATFLDDLVQHLLCDASRTGYAEAKRQHHQARRLDVMMQAAQATVQGKSKRLPQGRKYLNALKNRTNGTNYENAKTPRRRRGVLLSGDQIFVTILMPGPMVDAVTQDLMYWPFAAAGLALMIAPMSAL